MRRRLERGDEGTRIRPMWALLVLYFPLASLPARAVDGVIEINQAAALAGGITSCDQPGFPVVLCASGAYRLTSNLTYSSGYAIDLAAPDVTLDLNGMTVKGPSTCTVGGNGWVTSCTDSPNGGNHGIVSGSARSKIHRRRGSRWAPASTSSGSTAAGTCRP